MENNFNLESQVSKLYELRTQLTTGKDNYNKLLGQYEALINITENSGEVDKLPEDFLEGIRGYREQITSELTKMDLRIGYLNILIDAYEAKQPMLVEPVVTLMFNALGVMLGDPTATDEQ